MKHKKLLLSLLILVIVLVSGCSPRTIEGSCMNSCRNSHNCFTLDGEEAKECKTYCFELCYQSVINIPTSKENTSGGMVV